jgi:RimJ/RimL family protein N-acetyltransferase
LNNINSNGLPIGKVVEDIGPLQTPAKREYSGDFVTLQPVEPERDVDELFLNSHGSDVKERIWTYMAYGPFSTKDDMLDWLMGCKASTNMSFFTVMSKEISQRVGMMSILNVIEPMRTLELGNIWYSSIVHHTKVNTEVVYLMLREIFDELNYRRVEWKCDAFNTRSRAAALRLGFSFEGIFRQHYIIKNRNRDTAWFSMIDKDWPDIKTNMGKWLYSDESDISLSAINKPLLNPTCKAI